MRQPRSGFSLVELLIAIVIVGILAAITIPTFANTTAKADIAAVKSDLRNLATAQESYYYQNATYAPSTVLLNLTPSPGVTITIVQAAPSGWSATAVHPAAVPVTCAVFYGAATAVPPATTQGTIACK